MRNRKFLDVATCLFENLRNHFDIAKPSLLKIKKPGTFCDHIDDHLRQPGQLMFTGGSASEARPPPHHYYPST